MSVPSTNFRLVPQIPEHRIQAILEIIKDKNLTLSESFLKIIKIYGIDEEEFTEYLFMTYERRNILRFLDYVKIKSWARNANGGIYSNEYLNENVKYLKLGLPKSQGPGIYI